MNNELGRKITSLTLMTIMVAGGLTFAIPGVMPEAMAANANLFVSAENSQFNNRISGPQVVEVVIIDSNINTLDDALGEPDVTVNSKKLRMAQATDGNWYAYFAEVDQAQYADATQTTSADSGLDFGTFCRPADGVQVLGFSTAETKGIAVNSDIGIAGADTSVNPVTKDCNPPGKDNVNGTMNVVREPKALNTNANTVVGQIGFNSTLYPTTVAGMNTQFAYAAGKANQISVGDTNYTSNWPFIQLYDFSAGGKVTVAYNKAGGAQTATFSFDTADDITTTLDRTSYPRDSQVQLEIADFWLNIDPTDEDSWTFTVTSGSEAVKYGVYDENGSAVAGTEDDIVSDLTTLMNDDGKLTINGAANGQTDVIRYVANDNAVSVASSTVTLLESGVNTGIFTSYDSDDDSIIRITDTAARGTTATITYDDSSQSILVGHSFASLSMEIEDDEWNSGETATVTLNDQDQNKNSLSDEDFAVNTNSTKLIPTLITGNPFTLGENFTNSQLDTVVSNDYVIQTEGVAVTSGGTTTGFKNLGITGGTAVTTADMSVSKYSRIGYIDVDTTTNDVQALAISMEGTMAQLDDSINTNSTNNFYGTTIFSWDVRSINSTGIYGFYLANGTVSLGSGATYTNSLIYLAGDTAVNTGSYTSNAQGTSAVTSGMMDALDLVDASDSIQIVVLLQSGTDITNGVVYPVTFDFMTFGFTNSGEDAAERTSNQIIRLELEESGDNTGIFEGTLEYIMINQLNVQQAATFTGLSVISDEATFIAFEDLTDEDAPRVNYLDLGADGVNTQIADQLEAPSHSGKVSFDSESYKVADTVTITLEDADLNVDTDLIDVFTVVDFDGDADNDTVGIQTGLDSGFSFGSLGRLLDVTFDDAKWTDGVSACDTYMTNNAIDNGLFSTGFTLVETGANTGVFTGNFQVPSKYCTSTSTTGVSTTGVDLEVNYLDFRDASGEIIEVGDVAAIRANTGSITLDRTVYPVPFGTISDYDTNTAATPNGRAIFPVHATGLTGAINTAGENISGGDLTVHVRVNDPDYDVSATGEDQIAVGSAYGNAPVKISVIRGSETVILGYAGTNATDKGTIDTDNSSLHLVRTFGPMNEIAPDAGIFEADIVIRYTDGPDSSTCPSTDNFTNIKDASGDAVTDRFDEAAASGENYCILQGDILQVEYTDATDASGDSNTVTDSATFDLRNGVLQTDKSVYIIGSDIILTLIEPDFDLDNDAAETYDLDLIEWDSDAATTTVGDLGGATNAAAFDPEPSAFRETGDSTGIFQVVLEMPQTLSSDNLERGEQIDLEYTDWGPSGADYVGNDDEDVNVTIYTSNFGATVELDQKVYTWTDKVYITIVAPDHNMDSALIDEIGNTNADHIKVSTRGYDIDRYKLVETGVDTGIFTGEVILIGYSFDADGDGVNDLGVKSTSADGTGPTDGYLQTDEDDGLTVSFEYSEDETVVGSALIRWNIGEAQWLEASYPASGTGVVRIIDPDMNLDPEAVDNFNVDVWSDSDAGGIDLTVTETNEATGIFEGTVFFTVQNESSGHRLRVAEGDTVTAEYEDNTLPSPYTTADELNITATTLIGTVVPPLERAPAANLRTVDAFGNSLDTVSVDQQVQISADLSNGQDREQAFAYLVQIQDENGVTVSLAWITGSLSAGQSFSPALSWIPSEAGTYTATAFVWESVDNPTALSPPVSTTVNVR